VFPSKKAIKREREKLREMTNRHQNHKPIPVGYSDEGERCSGGKPNGIPG
jgi:hypothetical protein